MSRVRGANRPFGLVKKLGNQNVGPTNNRRTFILVLHEPKLYHSARASQSEQLFMVFIPEELIGRTFSTYIVAIGAARNAPIQRLGTVLAIAESRTIYF